MKTAVEIYKLLPKTNCGKCGTGTCFGFAAKLASHISSPDDCPAMSPESREILRDSHSARIDSPGTVYEQALVSLRPKIESLDFTKTARSFGAASIDADTLSITFLNEPYRVTKQRIFDVMGNEPRPWISILIYNHLSMPDPPPPSGEWITFSSLPAAHAKDKAWAGHVEQEIANNFSGNIDALKTACLKVGGSQRDLPGSHDAAYEFHFFPNYPVLLLFYDEVPEENFPAQCTLLLDKNVHRYLDLESIVVLGEEFAGRLKNSSEFGVESSER